MLLLYHAQVSNIFTLQATQGDIMGNILSEDEMLQMTLLLDFYSDILTERQQDSLDLYYNENWSLAEIGKKHNITRHGVFDNISRSREKLLKIEQKTGIVKRWLDMREDIEQAIVLTEKIKQQSDGSIKDLAVEILKIIKKINI